MSICLSASLVFFAARSRRPLNSCTPVVVASDYIKCGGVWFVVLRAEFTGLKMERSDKECRITEGLVIGAVV
jgi:hypothetical protein